MTKATNDQTDRYMDVTLGRVVHWFEGGNFNIKTIQTDRGGKKAIYRLRLSNMEEKEFYSLRAVFLYIACHVRMYDSDEELSGRDVDKEIDDEYKSLNEKNQ